MKKLTTLKLALATLGMAFLGSCSSQLYTFSPNSGGYHGTEKKTEIAQTQNTVTVEPTATASTNDEPALLAPAHTAAATALAQASAPKQIEQATAENTVTDKKAAKKALKAAKADLKQLKKDIKDGKQVQLDPTVKLLIVLGLIFLILGILLPLFWQIGVVLIVVGLILLILNTL